MSLARIYFRSFRLIGPEIGLAVFLVFANFALASAQFAEPVLVGRIVDRMSAGDAVHHAPGLLQLAPLIAAWGGFALFSILGSVFVGLHADRLAHRRRLAAMGLYFEHVLHLPMSFHGSTHSGRLLKGMLDGTAGLFWLWLSFFREKCVAFMALVFLLPLSLIINWRLGLLLILLVAVFAVLIVFVIRRTHVLQNDVERLNTTLSERASDVLSNVAVIQSFTRIESEAHALGRLIEAVLTAQLPVLSWWAVAVVAARAAATLTLLAIFLLGIWLHAQNLATIGQIVTFMAFSTMLIAKLSDVVGFINGLFMQAPKIEEFFDVLDTPPHVTDLASALDPDRLTGRVAFEGVSFSYGDGQAAVNDVSFEAMPGETIALVGATGSGKTTTLSLLHRVFDPQGDRHPRHDACRASTQYRRRLPGADAICALDRREPENREAGCERFRDRAGAGARPSGRLHRPAKRGPIDRNQRARPLAFGRRTPEAGDRPGAFERPADHDLRRSEFIARRRDRAAVAVRVGDGDPGAHDVYHRASPGDDPPC
jgi:ABC-type multidrug transport system fused ATPase/permease subunit